MKSVIRYSLLFLLLTFNLFLVHGVERKPVPKPSNLGYINDYANILNEAEKLSIFNTLKAYEDSTSTQIAVVIEQSLQNRDRFDRAMDFAKQWEVGQNGKNNGIVMYFAIDEKKIFILNADHTQGGLPDGLTGTIIRNYITPSFKQKQYYEGINSGIQQIILALTGEFEADEKDKKGKYPIIIFIVIIIIFLVLGRKNKGGGGYHSGGAYWFPTGGGGSGWSGGGSGGGFGGFGGGGGFNGGGAGGGW